MSCCFLSHMSPTSLALTCTWCLEQPQSEIISTSGLSTKISQLVLYLLLRPFHTLTGCDLTPFICNQSQKSAWKLFLKHHTLLSSLGERELAEEKMKEVEELVCKMYKLDSIGSVDKTRAILFSKKGKPEALPPISEALSLHVKW